MARLNPLTVAQFAAGAGWRGGDLAVATAVALAESGGWTDRPGGLWNLPGVPGGDPAGNAAKAFARWRGPGGWGQWASHRNRRYLLFMPAAGPAAAAAEAAVIANDPKGEVVDDIAEAAGKLPGAGMLDAAKSALTLAFKAGAWMANPDNWIRVAQVGIGGALIVGALVMIAKPAVESAAGGVAGTIVRPVVKGLVSRGGGKK